MMITRLRSIHLYLGCIFGPLLAFFAIPGIWQTLKLHTATNGSEGLALASTIHTARGLKAGGDLSSPLLQALVIAMAVGLVTTAIIGIVMAFRFGRNRRAVLASFAVGVLLPLALILISALS